MVDETKRIKDLLMDIYYTHPFDTDRQEEEILDMLDNELRKTLDIVKEDSEYHSDNMQCSCSREILDKATKLVYILENKKWLDLFDENFPEYILLTIYFRHRGEAMRDDMNQIAPEYNNL